MDSESSKTSLTPNGIIDFNCLQCKKEDFVTLQWDVNIHLLYTRLTLYQASGEYIMLAFKDGGLFFFDSNRIYENKLENLTFL